MVGDLDIWVNGRLIRLCDVHYIPTFQMNIISIQALQVDNHVRVTFQERGHAYFDIFQGPLLDQWNPPRRFEHRVFIEPHPVHDLYFINANRVIRPGGLNDGEGRNPNNYPEWHG